MTDIGAALRAKLVATNTVSTLVSARVYPRKLPQGATLPAVVYHAISGDDEYALKGIIGLAHTRLQVDSYASTRLVANTLADAIRDAICSEAGSMGTWGTVGVTACTPESGPRYDSQPLGDGGDEDQHITIRDYLISHVTS